MFFAVTERPIRGTAAIYALSPVILNKVSGSKSAALAIDGPTVKPLVHGAFDETVGNTEKVLAVIPCEVDARLMVQQSAFTIHGISVPLEEYLDSEAFLLKWLIPQDAKAHLRERVRMLGFSLSSLFPDLDHLSAEIRNWKLGDS